MKSLCSLRRLSRYLRGDEEGGSLVEFALVVPMLLLVVTGIFTFGMAMNNYVQLTNAVNISARYVAINSNQTTDPCSVASTAFYHAAPYLTASKLSFTLVLNGTSYSGTSCNSSSTTTGSAANLKSGANATLTVTYPCNLAVYGRTWASFNLVAQSTELVQ